MPQKYKRKTGKNSWTETEMKRAMDAVNIRGVGVRKAATQYNVPYSTLWDKLKQKTTKSRMGRRTVFSEETEFEIASHIKKLASMFYGLTKLELRRVCFEYAEQNNIKHPFNRVTKLAGKDWYYGFLRRNTDISLRKPEATSLNRINAFHKTDVHLLFDNLEQVYQKHKFTPDRIFNVDETGITTVHVPQKVLAAKNLRRLGAATSGERGKNITVVCAMSASGSYIPPLFIYPRQRLPQHLCQYGPPGSIYRCSKSGWITEEIFCEWLAHFSKHAHASTTTPVLLIMDNHYTHTTLTGYNFCKENGIVVVSLPPHTSHRTQPLDVAFYGPLKNAYNQECGTFLKVNSYEKISQEHVAGLFSKAYNRVATIEKAIKGFQATGIFPLNKHIFPEEDFTTPEQIISENSLTPVDPHIVTPPTNEPSTSGVKPIVQCKKRKLSISSDSDDSDMLVEVSDVEDFTMDKTIVNSKIPISKISPAPQRKESSKKHAKKQSIIFTTTPVKTDLEERERRKRNKKEVDNRNSLKRNIATQKKNEENKENTKTKAVPKLYKECAIEEHICLFCHEFGKDAELWYCCSVCQHWAHAACTDVETADGYVCDNCR